MALVHYEPANLFERFNNEMNRYLNSTYTAANQERDWTPAVDIREEDNRYVLTADIPGVRRDDVDITLEEGVLTVKGERKSDTEPEAGSYRRRERSHGTFVRQFSLPDTVDASNISAVIKEGVLEIGIPKQEKLQPRKITVS